MRAPLLLPLPLLVITSIAGAQPGHDAAFWRALLERDGVPPAGLAVEPLALELEAMLASTDPERRDAFGYTILATWVARDHRLPAEQVRALADRLAARMAEASSHPDAVFGRSFAALTLAAVVAADLDRPVLGDEGVRSVLDAATRYAATETDIRGWVEGRGWAHPAAHTADLLAFLARHPAVDRAGLERVLGAIADFSVRPHGGLFAFAEDERLARAALEVVRRDAVPVPALESWIARLGEPGTRLPAIFVAPERLDVAGYAAWRNGRGVLKSLLVGLEIADPAPPRRDELLALLRAALRGR